MQIEHTEALWLHEHYQFSLSELAELSGLPETELQMWVEDEVLVPLNPEADQWTFGADILLTIRKACRLHKELDLEPHSVALLIKLLERVQALEAEVRDLQAKLPRLPR